MSQALCFNNVTLSPIIRNSIPWIKAAELARALGYAREDTVSRILERNADEFTPDMTQVVEIVETVNLTVKARIFSLRGCHLIAMFARTPVAKAFRRIAKYQQLPPARIGEAVEYLVGMEIKAAQKALPPATPLYVDRLQLTPWDKVQLGKAAVAILERGDKVGPRTLECILLKLRYLDALHDKAHSRIGADGQPFVLNQQKCTWPARPSSQWVIPLDTAPHRRKP